MNEFTKEKVISSAEYLRKVHDVEVNEFLGLGRTLVLELYHDSSKLHEIGMIIQAKIHELTKEQ